MTDLASRPPVEIVEVGPRDGLQNESAPVSTQNKVRLIERAIAAGARRIEAVSFVHPGKVPQMADAEEVMAHVPRRSDVRYVGLVLNARGLDRAIAAEVDEVNVVVVATEAFSQRNQGQSVDEMLSTWHDIVQRAAREGIATTGTIAAAFGCPFEGEVSPAWVADLAYRMAQSQPDELALADTIGVGVPIQVRTLVEKVRGRVADLPLRFHFHNTRNTGYANALEAVRCGVTTLDASIGGIGGCPFAPAATGNIATEDLRYALERSGLSTGFDEATLHDISPWVTQLLDAEVPALVPRAGGFPPQPEGEAPQPQRGCCCSSQR